MPGSLDWDLLQSLHAVLEAGSFSAAARIRRLTQPTLGRHIDQLERQLGAPLFLRSPRGLVATDLALAFRPHLADMSAAAEAAARDATGVASGEGGVVRVAASDVIGIEVLPAMLTRFRAAHPGIDVELVLSNKNEDLTRRDADVAVRMSRPTQNSLVAKKVGDLTIGFYATPEYLERKGTPTDFDELEGHSLIGFDRDFPAMVGDLSVGRPITRDIFALRTDNDVAQLAALKAGFGIGACQKQIGRRFGLTPVMADLFSFKLDIWICMHETLRGSPRMRLMFDHLAKELAEYAAEGG
ncbi:LysR family transcriptional regulator [Phenylobacterium sp.]|uniref:LysR family transcriptional regulator n=1 Tax=Phenylobacterium sp. TaxID=1871053 RepID=UPI0025D5A4CF|nr:LysR family transcriptional regulator [Phenylobacterium sp.]MBX3485904.1 LysR family transcriptional regulator [Phenylobacterium sp.]MCW5758221.1 LysR family transcriptional regulator [Phenylobacterium sp.]